MIEVGLQPFQPLVCLFFPDLIKLYEQQDYERGYTSLLNATRQPLGVLEMSEFLS